MKKRKATLSMAIDRSPDDENGTQVETPEELLTEIADKASFGNALAVVPQRETSPSANCIYIKGNKYPLNTEIDIDPSLIVSEFKGNLRNMTSLEKIDELALSIIEVGRNTEPVKARPTNDGSGLELIKGKRRTAAVRRANELCSHKIPLRIIIAEIDDIEATKEAAMENLCKEDFTPWELSDQLNALLSSGAVSKVADLGPYLPSDKKDATRTTIYSYLEPSRLPKEVRAYIDEDCPVKNSTITKLARRLSLVKGIEQEVYEAISNSFLKGKHETIEIIRYIDYHYGNSTTRVTPETMEIENSNG